ncbi:PQQ-dependent sugar dehydrogenase [Paracoccaceae bacterium]
MRVAPALILCLLAQPLAATVVETSAGPMKITALLTGLDEPWAVDILPDGRFLVTERDAPRLSLVDGARRQEISGLPEVFVGGQGGLLDVMVPRDFASSREIWLGYAISPGIGSAAAFGFGRLTEDGTRLEGFTQVFAGGLMPATRHYGLRLVEAPDGSIYATLGERGTGPDGMQAQYPTRAEGKVIYVRRDGSPATELPGALPGVFSLGHRNPQGTTLAPDGTLLLVEHGPQGGDELNRVEEGLNYGWPVITWGEQYGGGAIGEGGAKDGMEPPLHYWVPSIAPSGLMVYSGRLVPDWAGDIFTGSLNSDFVSRLDPDTPAPTGYAEERIAAPETGRVRDVTEAPDGAIWFLSVTDGTLYRMAPQ